jgi:hypothetical protein
MNGTRKLQSFADDIWMVDGPPAVNFFIPLPTRMIVVKLSDGSLWINSPVDVGRETLEQIQALGAIRYLVAPTPLHVWRLVGWHALFPEAELWGPSQIPRAFAGLPFSGKLGDVVSAPWTSDLEDVAFRGNKFAEEFEFFHNASRTLMMTDFVQNYPSKEHHVPGNLVKRLGGVLNGGVPRDIRWTITNRKLARTSLQRILAWDFDKVILAHGCCISHDARAFVERAFRWLDI